MRLIDADALHEALKNKQMWVVRRGDKHNEGYTYDQVHFAIDDAPSIDIVRCAECKACKRKRGTFKGEPIFFYRCEENNRDVESDDYCSWGERRG